MRIRWFTTVSLSTLLEVDEWQLTNDLGLASWLVNAFTDEWHHVNSALPVT